ELNPGSPNQGHRLAVPLRIDINDVEVGRRAEIGEQDVSAVGGIGPGPAGVERSRLTAAVRGPELHGQRRGGSLGVDDALRMGCPGLDAVRDVAGGEAGPGAALDVVDPDVVDVVLL